MTDKGLNVSPISVPKQQSYGGEVFPLVLRCESESMTVEDAVNWAKENHVDLLRQCQTHGAILFRGFPLSEPAEFDRFIAAFEIENFPYEVSLSNAVRTNFTPRVFSANEAPSTVTIYLHHEMAQTPIFPSKLFFCCWQAAEAGGATPLCRSDVLFDQMQERFPQFAYDCETKGLKYSNVMPAANDASSGMGRSWQSTFRVETREEAQARMSEYGYAWEWLEDGSLRATTPILPAVREVSPGRKVFFNQLIAAFCGWKDSRNDPSKSITFGDGSPLDRGVVMEVANMAEQLTFDLPWQNGDVALVDNFLVMHGRRTFQGPRKILASLLEMGQHAHAT
ncbi:TauD/TfdA family dioxygenase [Blastopirellula sediminis]|nr:TauD/TfdA family dioxygenase [Blastopirellula sediminis]